MSRHVMFLPLAFVAGVHGFAILAPYLAVCVTAQTMIVQRRQRKALARSQEAVAPIAI